jgi:hypothetical protein
MYGKKLFQTFLFSVADIKCQQMLHAVRYSDFGKGWNFDPSTCIRLTFTHLALVGLASRGQHRIFSGISKA